MQEPNGYGAWLLSADDDDGTSKLTTRATTMTTSATTTTMMTMVMTIMVRAVFFIRKHVEMSSGLYNASSRSIPFSFKCFPRACSVLPAACQTRPPCGCPKVVAEGEASAPSFVHRG